MTSDNAIEAVFKALERQHSDSSKPSPAEPLPEIVSRSPNSSPERNVRIEDPSRLPRTKDSMIKARYALTILRVAQTSEQQTAARLVRGLAYDSPHPNERPEIAEIHLRAIDTFFQLAASLGGATNSKHYSWNTALGAAENWLRAVNAQQ
jgi:hypothetical protein